MKRFLITGMLLLAIGGSTSLYAQGSRQYDDDIYSNSKTRKAQAQKAEQEAQRDNENVKEVQADGDTYTSSGNNNARQYSESGDYADYENDYYYATSINRFNYPFYNRGYYSGFYNPYWYDPYWVDPYWGWSPWVRPGFSITFGMGGPYWSSYWGWQAWYGYDYFGSYYGYPGYYGGYYSGYWNGYYAGLYNNYGRGYRTVTYGPRYSLNANHNNYAHNVGYHGFRRDVPVTNGQAAGTIERSANPRELRNYNSTGVVRESNANNNGTAIKRSPAEGGDRRPREFFNRDNNNMPQRDRGGSAEENTGSRNNGMESPRNNSWNNGGRVRSEEQAPEPRRGWFNRGEQRAEQQPSRTVEQSRMQPRYEQPRYEQRSAPAPRMETPSRSFGGGNSGGGGFRGGRR